MKKNLLPLFLSLVLALAVTDYIWIDWVQEDEVVAELLESQEEESKEEKLREGASAEEKKAHQSLLSLHGTNDHFHVQLNAGFIKVGHGFQPLSKKNKPGLYLLHGQLKLDC